MSDVRFRFRPLTWVGPTTPVHRRSHGTFRATYRDTLDLLTAELAALGATEAVIEAAFQPGDIRLDGLPRANARAGADPGVRVAFTSRHGPLIYQTDRYTHWQANLRGIALGLQALRAVDRYGITGRGEQYRGWAALDPPAPEDARREALTRLGELAGLSVQPHAGPADVERLYRVAARRWHPDTGGTKEKFQELQDVMGVLREATTERDTTP